MARSSRGGDDRLYRRDRPGRDAAFRHDRAVGGGRARPLVGRAPVADGARRCPPPTPSNRRSSAPAANTATRATTPRWRPSRWRISLLQLGLIRRSARISWMSARRKGRELALQVLYQLEMSGTDPSRPCKASPRASNKPERARGRPAVVRGVLDRSAEIEPDRRSVGAPARRAPVARRRQRHPHRRLQMTRRPACRSRSPSTKQSRWRASSASPSRRPSSTAPGRSRQAIGPKDASREGGKGPQTEGRPFGSARPATEATAKRCRARARPTP